MHHLAFPVIHTHSTHSHKLIGQLNLLCVNSPKSIINFKCLQNSNLKSSCHMITLRYLFDLYPCKSCVVNLTMEGLLLLPLCVITDALSTVSSAVHSSPTPICFCPESCAQLCSEGVTMRGTPCLCTITARTELSLAQTVYYSSPPIQLNMQTLVGLPGSLIKLQESRFRRGADSFCTH